jgi:sphinganine-1-phosphate aldolase
MYSPISSPTGSSADEVHAELQHAKVNDVDWRAGRTNLYVQFGGDDVLAVARRAADLYFSENAHGLEAFPSVRRLEAEVIRWVLDLVSGGPNADGCLTSGGSESILVALKTARDWARARNASLLAPKIIVPQSAHPAFDKAASILGLEVVRVPIMSDYRADVAQMESHICPRTIALAGSAPQFGHGLVDPICDLAFLARRYNLWLHVDACIGALMAPFARIAGAQIPAFDFSIDGVRSISADLHKYGFAAKGISTALFRHKCWRPHYTFEFDDWPIGSYGSPAIAGTRPAAPIASAWAVIRFLGHDGFVRIAREVLDSARRMQEGLKTINGVSMVCEPDLPILAWQTAGVPIHRVADGMRRRGWFIRTMSTPASIHLGMLSMHQGPVVDDYLASVSDTIGEFNLS